MKILVINCFPQTSHGKQDFSEFLSLVKDCIEDDDILETCTHRPEHLKKFLWQQPEVKGLYPSLLKVVRQCFFDIGDGADALDESQLRTMLVQCYQRLGTPLKADFILQMEHSVHEMFKRYDTNLSGDIDIEECVEMLNEKPWCDLLPEPLEVKQMQQEGLRNFCELDIVIVEGDPNLLPWNPDASALVQMIYSVWRAQQWQGDGLNICLLGSTCVAQIMHFLMIRGPHVPSVFNGLVAGQGDRTTKPISAVNVTADAVRQKGLFLDNSCGRCFSFSAQLSSLGSESEWREACSSGVWKGQGNLGLCRNGSKTQPSRKYEKKRSEQQDNSKSFVKLKLQDVGHWVFQGLQVPSFTARCDRFWDLNLDPSAVNCMPHDKLGELNVMASSQRGPEVLEMNGDQMLLTMFPFKKLFRESVLLMKNFIARQTASMKVSADSKSVWYDWMQRAGGSRLLDVKLDHAVKYEQSDRPLFADFKSCWRGRLNDPDRAHSCPPEQQEWGEPNPVQQTTPSFPLSIFATETSGHQRPVGFDMQFSCKAAQECKGVRRVAPQSTHDSRGMPRHYGSTYHKFLGNTQRLASIEDPYKTQEISKGCCFRSQQRADWIDRDFQYALGLGASHNPAVPREMTTTPLGGRQPTYPVHNDYNPLNRPAGGEIMWVADNYGRRAQPDRWQGRHISSHIGGTRNSSKHPRSMRPVVTPCAPVDFHRTSSFSGMSSNKVALSKMPYKSHNKTFGRPMPVRPHN